MLFLSHRAEFQELPIHSQLSGLWRQNAKDTEPSLPFLQDPSREQPLQAKYVCITRDPGPAAWKLSETTEPLQQECRFAGGDMNTSYLVGSFRVWQQ